MLTGLKTRFVGFVPRVGKFRFLCALAGTAFFLSIEVDWCLFSSGGYE